MTEYGRGPGSEPWHPEDPLYGDMGRAEGRGDSEGHPSPEGYPQQQDGWAGYGQEQAAGYPQAHDAGAPYPQAHAPGWEWEPGAPAAYGSEPYPAQQPGDPYAGSYYQDPYATGQGYPPPAPQHLRQQQPPQYAQEYPPQHYQQYPPQERYQAAPPPGEPYRQQPGAHRAEARPPGAGDPGPDPETGWDPGPDQGEREFFARDDDREDWDEDTEAGHERPSRRGGGAKPRRRRGGCACLGVAVLLVGGLGGGVYFGVQLYNDRFGPPGDFSGEGTGEVEVEIPDGATLTQMGNILKEQGVIKSVGAFTAAAEGAVIQPGFYLLRNEMSAEAAVAMLTDPAQLNTLTIPEGKWADQVYEMIDEKLGLEQGTAAQAAADGDWQLPEWAPDEPELVDPLEGFLFPARYDIGSETTPEELLAEMVARANAAYVQHDIEAQAEKLGLDSPWEVVIVASLAQEEGKTYEDFQQMAEVVYNRLDPDNPQTYGKLQFDSTYNYATGQKSLKNSEEDVNKDDHPYNTYHHKGLPPGPINNPGDEAIEGALNPSDHGWWYFISIDGEETRFTDDYEQHLEWREEFNDRVGIGD